MSEPGALRLTVHGQVQGVFYRDWTVQAARDLGLAGWVRNESDGTVTAHLQGDGAAIRGMVERLHQGPPAARVERIDSAAVAPEKLAGFERR